ncbi:MAG: SHOCT domain-containing protein [Clostridia bacterium]
MNKLKKLELNEKLALVVAIVNVLYTLFIFVLTGHVIHLIDVISMIVLIIALLKFEDDKKITAVRIATFSLIIVAVIKGFIYLSLGYLIAKLGYIPFLAFAILYKGKETKIIGKIMLWISLVFSMGYLILNLNPFSILLNLDMIVIFIPFILLSYSLKSSKTKQTEKISQDTTDIATQLDELNQKRENGELTEEQYTDQRQEILQSI